MGAALLRSETSSALDVDALMSSLMRSRLTRGEAHQWSAAFRARAR
jgi:hypothetical protein